jgi:hydrogenase-4 component F
MGTLLAAAAIQTGGVIEADALFWTHLASAEAHLDPTLMKFAFVFVLVGYGTKAGLAPIHSWLPDAHSQAPAPVSAMFSGFLLNTALYCIVRFMPPARHALGDDFAGGLLTAFGTLSILVAAGFIVFQHDAKRLLAYHSVEHMGIIALGYGLGPLGAFAALFHTLNHSVCKSLAFFAVGRLGQRFGSHDMRAICGALRVDNLWGAALLISLLALIGVAPFAVFMSEYQLLRAAVDADAWLVLVLFLIASGVVFVSALRHLIDMAYGTPNKPQRVAADGRMALSIIVAASAILLLLGLWMPLSLADAIGSAAAVLAG